MSARKIEITNDQNVVIDGVKFENPIENVYPGTCWDLGDKIVILYHASQSMPQYTYLTNANIFAFDRKGQVIWQVQPLSPDGTGALGVTSYYVLLCDDKGELAAEGDRGTWATIDAATGKIIKVKHPARPW
jgi:hypothetical protein